MCVKYKITNFECIETGDVLSQYLENKSKTEISFFLKGIERLPLLSYDQTFKGIEVIYINKNCYYIVGIDNIKYLVPSKYIKLSEDTETVYTLHGIKNIITTDKVTVLTSTYGKSYKTHLQDGDTFDIEKAVMILLLKQGGWSVPELEKIIKGVKFKGDFKKDGKNI